MPFPTEPLFTLRLRRDQDRAVTIRNGPHGHRAIAAAAEGGSFQGPSMRGSLLTGTSGDWATLRSDGSFIIDARLTLLTDDGVPILMTYRGVGAFDEDGEAWMHISPLFETGDGPYDWLNLVQGIGFGRLDDGEIVYDVHVISR